MYIFEISTKRWIFYAPFDPFKEKKFSSLTRDNELFLRAETGQKWKKPLKILKNGFL
jgi:hypothetical protein